MIKKFTFILCLLVLTVGCIKPDIFAPEGSFTKQMSVSIAPAVINPMGGDPINLEWEVGDELNLFYTPLKEWSRLSIDDLSDISTDGKISVTQDFVLKSSARTHTFYAMSPALDQSQITPESDPSEMRMSLVSIQNYADGYGKYMVLCGSASTGADELINVEMDPSLSLMELNLSSNEEMIVKTLKLTTVGGGIGQGISGDYTIDITDNSVNMRQTNTDNIAIDFGESGFLMDATKSYKVYAVVLPAKLEGLRFSVSGTTNKSTIDMSVCNAMDLKQGDLHSIDLTLAPGPIRQDYSLTVTSGTYGTSNTTYNNMLGYQGAKKTASTAVKGIDIAESKAVFEYENGNSVNTDAFWQATAPEWIVLSKTSGEGAAKIDVTVLPNLKPLTAPENAVTVNLSQDGTANTYMINGAGKYSFDASVMGNGNEGIISGAGFIDSNGAVVSSAAISGASAKVIWQEYPNLITDIALSGTNIEFTTGATLYPGNAIIALYDGAESVVWSWQIWCTDALGDDDVITNANTNPVGVAAGKNLFSMMNRNLGAMGRNYEATYQQLPKREGTITITQYTDASLAIPTGKSFTTKVYQIGVSTNSYYQPLFASGILYQWGRKDPIMTPYFSGNWPHLLRFDSQNEEMAKITLLEGGANKGNNNTIADAIKNPDAYFKPNGTVNWLDVPVENLWGNLGGNVASIIDGSRPRGVKTIYDPCPVGYMVPTMDVWSAFTISNVVGIWSNRGGYFFKRNSADNAGTFYPAIGYINSSGLATSLGGTTNYWSNTTMNPSANTYQLNITSTAVNNILNVGRGVGNPLRCMKTE